MTLIELSPYLGIGSIATAGIFYVGSGLYNNSRWKAQDYANRWMRAENARMQKELNKQRDAEIQRLIRDDKVIASTIEKSVEKALEKAIKKYLDKIENN